MEEREEEVQSSTLDEEEWGRGRRLRCEYVEGGSGRRSWFHYQHHFLTFKPPSRKVSQGQCTSFCTIQMQTSGKKSVQLHRRVKVLLPRTTRSREETQLNIANAGDIVVGTAAREGMEKDG